jgi:hypothetical protein
MLILFSKNDEVFRIEDEEFTLPSHSGGPGFKSRPEDRLS